MASGYIYFATSIPGWLKVGKFAAHLTVADKERQYRTNVPEFKIHHAYFCEDVDAEEARVLAILRLIGGTAIRGAGKENFKMPVETAIAAAAATSRKELADVARKAIGSHVLGDGKTVGELLRELDDNLKAAPGRTESYAARNLQITQSLMAVGLYPVIADTEDDLNAVVYGSVVDAKRLLKTIPGLKPVTTALEDLTF